MKSATVTRQTLDGMTVVRVELHQMVAFATQYGDQIGNWTVTVGRKVLPRMSSAGLRTNRAVLRRSEYARALYRVEIGKA